MCGINGIFAYHYAANPVDRAELYRTRDSMVARGPDGAGAWFSEGDRVGLGHRRLAIIDLSPGGAQPMRSADGGLVITFNGEIYNYRELRRDLEARGRVFVSQSDTEVLLHLYAVKGAEMVADLRGMFAFALWDGDRQTMLLARDPYGIKPLYYFDDGWTLRFASQVKALVAGSHTSGDIDPAGAVGFYLFGSIPEPFTMLRDVRCLPAGATLLIDRKGVPAPIRYHSIARAYGRGNSPSSPRAAGLDAARSGFLESVRAHLIADVPVGAFLSAGVDSGALVGLMRDAGAQDIQTVTVGFEEFSGRAEDETAIAADVAARYGTRHSTRLVTRAEFEADLPRILAAMDQPTIDGINTWFVAKASNELGLKVAISGLGGDELLGGYPSFRDLPRWARFFQMPSLMPGLGVGFRMASSGLLDRLGLNPKAAGMIEYGGTFAGGYLLRRGLFMPWELDRVLDPEIVRQGMRRLMPKYLIEAELAPMPDTAFGKVSTLESALYMRQQLLRDTDWASMAHSLEVRVPLVDHVLLSQVAPLGGAFGSHSGKSLLAGAPTRPLPEAIVNRAKTGFTTPVAQWMRESRAIARGPMPTQSRKRQPWARGWSAVVGRTFGLSPARGDQ